MEAHAEASARGPAAALGTPAAQPMWDWRLSQVFGGDKLPDEEIPEGLHPPTSNHKEHNKQEVVTT